MKQEKTLVVKPINIETATIIITSDTDLILNKMDAPTTRMLTDIRKDKSKTIAEKNIWEEIATKIHWQKPYGDVFTEDSFRDALMNNAPCISAFGLKKSFGQAVVRNGIDTYSTKFDATMNIIAENNLVPIRFAEHYIDEKLMSPKRGAPVLVRQNRFVGWSAEIPIQYIEGGTFSLEQIIQVINLAGFSMGIGSGRSSGYGRYHVTGVK